jgi:hypothetical protein
MKSLLKTSWDLIEKAIDEMLNEHMKTWGWYDYFVINENNVIVKVYDLEDTDRLMFTIKAKLNGEKLEVVEVS